MKWLSNKKGTNDDNIVASALHIASVGAKKSNIPYNKSTLPNQEENKKSNKIETTQNLDHQKPSKRKFKKTSIDITKLDSSYVCKE